MGHTGSLKDRSAHAVVMGGKFVAVLLIGAAVAGGPALAQKAKAKGAGSQTDPGWVKKCKKGPIAERDKNKKLIKSIREVCITQFENFKLVAGKGGRAVIVPFVSASIRKVEGRASESLVVSVPLGMAIAPGIRVAVVNKDVWLKSQKKEKIDQSKLKTILLKYLACEPTGCTAEIGIKAEALNDIKKGAGFLIAPIDLQRGPVVFKVPLKGFTKAFEGKPVDLKKHQEQRTQYFKRVIEQVRAQQAAAAKAFPTKNAAPKKK